MSISATTFLVTAGGRTPVSGGGNGSGSGSGSGGVLMAIGTRYSD